MLQLLTDLPIISYEMIQYTGSQSVWHEDCRFLCLLNGTLEAELLPSPQDSVSSGCFTSHEADSPPVRYLLHGEDILYLPADTSCLLTARETCLILFVCLHPCFLLDVPGFSFERMKHCYLDDAAEVRNTLNRRLAELVMACLQADKTDSCNVYANAYELLHFLSLHGLETSSSPDGSDKPGKKLEALEQYLEASYMKTVSLSDAAAALRYTPQYLSSFLKKHMDMTFQDYLNTFRIKAAVLLLRHTRETPAKIALLCGFPNQSSFQKSFEKRTACTAEDYRSTYLKAADSHRTAYPFPVTNISLIMDYMFNYMNYTPLAAKIHETTLTQREQVNVSHKTPLIPNWNVLVNLGTASDMEKPAFRHHLTLLQQELHFQYARCTEIFSLVKVYTMEEEKAHDFSRVFRVIDFLRSLRLRPFLDIDCKPFHVYKEEDSILDYETWLSSSRYDDFLFEFLPEFIKACITRYGFDEFSTWRFELWRRYNVSMTSLEAPRDFVRRFEKTAGLIKSLVPSAKLGAPGFNGFLDTENFTQVMAAFQGAKYPPDFISAYYFPYQAERSADAQKPVRYTTNRALTAMTSKIQEWKEMLKSLGFSGLPFYITEYSAYLNAGNYINDSTYPAVYLLEQCIQSYGLADGLGYWLATDISLDYGNPSSPLFGGNGLITKDGIRKPAFFAQDFLNRLGGELLAKGEHFIAAASGTEAIQILVYYASSLNQGFAKSPLNQELLHYPYSAFDEVPPLDFHMTLTHLAKGSYVIRETSLDLKHGNVLSTWGQLDHQKNIGPEEIDYMKHQSIPSVHIRTEEIDGLWQLHTTLNHNEARLFTLHLRY